MDKKIKKAAEKITMPEDMKERIIKACEASADKNIIRNDNDGYTDVVSGTERIEPKRRILQTISAVAACAVLLSGLGATGVLLHRHNSQRTSGSDMADENENRICPFGDFSTFGYKFDAGDGKYGEYSAETYARLSDFLNKFDWGSELEEYETRTPEQDIEGQMYNISWTNGDTPPVDCNIHIANDGFVTYSESMMDPETGVSKTITENSSCYKIDFDAFDGGVQAIIRHDEDVEESTAAVENVTEAVTKDVTIDASELFNEFLASEYFLPTLPYIVIGEDKQESIRNFLGAFEWNETENYDHIAHVNTGWYNRPVLTRLEFGGENGVLFICEDNIAELRAEKNGKVVRAVYSCDSNEIIAGVAEIIRGGNGIAPSPFDILNDYKVLNGYDGEYMEFTNMQYISVQLCFDSFEWTEVDDESYIPDGSDLVPMTFVTPEKDRYIYITEHNGLVFVDKTSPDTRVYIADEFNNAIPNIREITKPFGPDWTIDVSIRDNMKEEIDKGENASKVDEFIINEFADMLGTPSGDDEYKEPKYYINVTYRDPEGNDKGYTSYTVNTNGSVEAYYYNVCFDGEHWPEGFDSFMIDLDRFEAAIAQ